MNLFQLKLYVHYINENVKLLYSQIQHVPGMYCTSKHLYIIRISPMHVEYPFA